MTSQGKVFVVGNYRFTGRRLGKGNFAKVEEGVHLHLNMKVAIKVMDTTQIKEDYVIRNLYREAKIMSKLCHPCIASLFQTMQHGSVYYLVTELVGGGDLCTFIKAQKNGRLEERVARVYARQLVSAISHMHRIGIVHRDLKMENIMLTIIQTQIKIVDFGLSNFYSDENPLKTKCGSPEYAAPELFVDGKEYGPEVDLWSLGVILYGMVVGQLPFVSNRDNHCTSQERRKKLLEQINRGVASTQKRALANFSSDFKSSLIPRLLVTDSSKRITIGELLFHPWITGKGKKSIRTNPLKDVDDKIKNIVCEHIAQMLNVDVQDICRAIRSDPLGNIAGMYNLLVYRKRMSQSEGDMVTRPMFSDPQKLLSQNLYVTPRPKTAKATSLENKQVMEAAKLFESIHYRPDVLRSAPGPAPTPQRTPSARNSTISAKMSMLSAKMSVNKVVSAKNSSVVSAKTSSVNARNSLSAQIAAKISAVSSRIPVEISKSVEKSGGSKTRHQSAVESILKHTHKKLLRRNSAQEPQVILDKSPLPIIKDGARNGFSRPMSSNLSQNINQSSKRIQSPLTGRRSSRKYSANISASEASSASSGIPPEKTRQQALATKAICDKLRNATHKESDFMKKLKQLENEVSARLSTHSGTRPSTGPPQHTAERMQRKKSLLPVSCLRPASQKSVRTTPQPSPPKATSASAHQPITKKLSTNTSNYTERYNLRQRSASSSHQQQSNNKNTSKASNDVVTIYEKKKLNYAEGDFNNSAQQHTTKSQQAAIKELCDFARRSILNSQQRPASVRYSETRARQSSADYSLAATAAAASSSTRRKSRS